MVITPPKDQRADELQAALLVARENENRWIGMSPEFSADSQGMEQWASTAKLRRLEVERIEALLAGLSEPSSSPQSHVPQTGLERADSPKEPVHIGDTFKCLRNS